MMNLNTCCTCASSPLTHISLDRIGAACCFGSWLLLDHYPGVHSIHPAMTAQQGWCATRRSKDQHGMHCKPVHKYMCLHNMLPPSSLPPFLLQPPQPHPPYPQPPLGGWPIMRRSKKCPCFACHAAGAISEPQVIAQFLTLLAGGLGVSYTLDRWAGHEFPTLLCLATFGSFISYIYSAPPLKLKQSGWIGNYALGSSYIALPWWAGQVSHFLLCLQMQLTRP